MWLKVFFVICQNVPSPQRQQTSALVGIRLDFFGGGNTGPPTNEVCRYTLGTSCLSPIDNSTVFLIEGGTWIITSATTDYYSYTSAVYKFNSKTSQWTTQTINNFNSSFAAHNEIQAVIDNDGKIFIFGGVYYDNLKILFYNDMDILDITTMTWSTQLSLSSSLLMSTILLHYY
ncbi:hypothetical protein F8M41_007451 [Gigaspora margarita]|uniref:Kelch repeat protein n=1 Tax=Gigaspora margarita TaxID=4874 RepID=A0A8H4ERC5_GIGMA|nr:hypothetical protein F8M41_007451 [Gigaspora margarita]